MKKPKSSELRTLVFKDLNEAVKEARSLHRCGYTRRGKWSLGQICQHLRLVQDPSIEGYPRWMSLFAFLRPFMRWAFMGRILRGDSPTGVPTSSIFVPPSDLDDEKELELFAESVSRLIQHSGKFHPHPGFGRLDRDQLLAVHAAHAAHHLRFLVASEDTSSE